MSRRASGAASRWWPRCSRRGGRPPAATARPRSAGSPDRRTSTESVHRTPERLADHDSVPPVTACLRIGDGPSSLRAPGPRQRPADADVEMLRHNLVTWRENPTRLGDLAGPRRFWLLVVLRRHRPTNASARVAITDLRSPGSQDTHPVIRRQGVPIEMLYASPCRRARIAMAAASNLRPAPRLGCHPAGSSSRSS